MRRFDAGGVSSVCCVIEHVGGPRSWTTEEVYFSSSLATFMTLALEAHQRREAEQALVLAKEVGRSRQPGQERVSGQRQP